MVAHRRRGVVTSQGVGMSVPDWPNTYGYNMFYFPFSQWIGGIFWEHSHRLVASVVGFMTLLLAVWAQGKNGRLWLRYGFFPLGLLASLIVFLRIQETRRSTSPSLWASRLWLGPSRSSGLEWSLPPS